MNESTDYDGGWKEILEHYFRPFLELCFPSASAEIDWNAPLEFPCGYAKQDVIELFRLIDWFLALPADLTVAFRRDLLNYEKEKAMPYVTSIERLGRQEGRQEGRVQTLQEDILDILETRFGEVPAAIREQVHRLKDERELKDTLRQAVRIVSLKEFHT